jgi:hypothetical protein
MPPVKNSPDFILKNPVPKKYRLQFSPLKILVELMECESLTSRFGMGRGLASPEFQEESLKCPT